MPQSLPSDVPAAGIVQLTEQNAPEPFRCLKSCSPHSPWFLHLILGCVTISAAWGIFPLWVFQEVSTGKYPEYFSNPVPLLEEAAGEWWFPKRKSCPRCDTQPNSLTTCKNKITPCKNKLIPSKWPSFATDKAGGGGSECKSSTFSPKNSPQPLNVQKAEFQEKLHGAICFHPTLLMLI